MLSKDLEQTLNEAFRGARAKRHEFMTVEHLLLALLDNNDAIRVLKACGADLGALRGDLIEFVAATTPLIPEDEDERETQPTLGFQRVLQRAVFHVQSSGKHEVSGANVLVAIFSEAESQAVYFLKTQAVARLDHNLAIAKLYLMRAGALKWQFNRIDRPAVLIELNNQQLINAGRNLTFRRQCPASGVRRWRLPQHAAINEQLHHTVGLGAP